LSKANDLLFCINRYPGIPLPTELSKVSHFVARVTLTYHSFVSLDLLGSTLQLRPLPTFLVNLYFTRDWSTCSSCQHTALITKQHLPNAVFKIHPFLYGFIQMINIEVRSKTVAEVSQADHLAVRRKVTRRKQILSTLYDNRRLIVVPIVRGQRRLLREVRTPSCLIGCEPYMF
jgi:hypothetical protein